MNTEQSAVANAAEGVEMGLIKRIIGIFTSPGQTFEAVRTKPNWLVPAIVLVVIGLAIMTVIRPVIQKEQMTKQQEMMEKRGMSQDQIDEAIEKGQKIGGIAMYPSAIIFSFLSFVVGAAVWLFLSNTILGGQAKFVQMLAVNVYREFVGTVGFLIKTPIILSKQTMNVHFSIATFLPEASKESFLYKLLAQVELFNIWSIAVLSIGIAVVGRFKVNSVWPWVAIIYLLWYAASSALGGLFGV